MQSLSRSRDENLVVDVESALRLAQQQAQLTGSAEPLLAALRSADQRLARAAQPRLNPLQRAIARDMDRIKAATLTDVPVLMLKLDELARLADDLPVANAMVAGNALCARRLPWPRLPRPRPPVRRQATSLSMGVFDKLSLNAWSQRTLDNAARRSAQAGAREPHRPAGGGAAGRPRAGLLPAREHEAASLLNVRACRCWPARTKRRVPTSPAANSALAGQVLRRLVAPDAGGRHSNWQQVQSPGAKARRNCRASTRRIAALATAGRGR
jgi:hypothetical protein